MSNDESGALIESIGSVKTAIEHLTVAVETLGTRLAEALEASNRIAVAGVNALEDQVAEQKAMNALAAQGEKRNVAWVEEQRQWREENVQKAEEYQKREDARLEHSEAALRAQAVEHLLLHASQELDKQAAKEL